MSRPGRHRRPWPWRVTCPAEAVGWALVALAVAVLAIALLLT